MRALVLLVVAGCGNSHQQAVDAGVDATFERCAPLAYDPMRYHFIGPTTVLTWSQAYGACGAVGMELTSINDTDEYGRDLSQPPPYWIGTNYSDDGLEALDGCPPFLMWAPGEPATMDLDTCVYQGPDGMHEIMCSGSSLVLGALCETPRLNQSCATMGSTYASSGTHAKADADVSCKATGGYVVEINTSAELQAVLDKFSNQNDFWIAGMFNGTVFLDTTGCPEVFGWANGEPMPATGMCVAYTRGVGMQMRNCADVVGTICETN